MDVATEIAQHVSAAIRFAVALEQGRLDRRATSQLMVLSDAEYQEGVDRLRAEQPVLHADLRMFATFARI